MLRRLLLLALLLISTFLVASCYVRTYGPPGARCRNECAYWGMREQCDRFCRVHGPGHCLAWESRCHPVRQCVRWESRCY